MTSASPCNLDCPAGTDVRQFLTLASKGDAVSAWHTIVERNPLPAVCGRVCYHPCEAACNRLGLDDRVAVHAIERAVASRGGAAERDEGSRSARPLRATAPASRSSARVPPGLSCAYHLARAGHQPVIFEAADEAGGMLRYGIPAYRLPREVLADEIDLLRRLGVEIRTGQRIGANVAWSDLSGFDAIFIGPGNQRSKPAGVAGRDARRRASGD